MKIAVTFVAEPYQIYHGAAVAFELNRMTDVEVSIYYNDPDSAYHLERIRSAYGEDPIKYTKMDRTLIARLVERIRIFGFYKTSVYRSSEKEFARYDAVLTVEDTAYRLFERRAKGDRPRLIYMPHGAGDGVVGFSPRTRIFDLVLLPGNKTADRMLSLGLVRPDNHEKIGLVKLETADRLRMAQGPLFAEQRLTVLYNSHKTRGLASWNRFIHPLLNAFNGNEDYNLIVAPHVKKFRRRSRRLRRKWEARSTRNILIDTGSDRSLDMSYTRAADIYVGDISSQVYEFLVEPRPCVFVNAYDVAWKNDPSFAHWHLGDVITDPADLMPAIRAAPSRHPVYLEKQKALAAASLGDRSPGASKRAADAIIRFLKQ